MNPRRRIELGLLIMAGVIVGAAYTLASLGRDASIPANVGPFLAIVLGLFVGAHLVVRKLAPNADPVLLPIAALLNGIGYVFIARLNERLAAQQAAWTAVGITGFAVTLYVVKRVRTLERMRYTIGLIGLVLVVLPAIPFVGREINGAKIWVRLGPVSFQPGEFAKLALAVFFAAYLVEQREVLSMATFKLGPFRMPEPVRLIPVLLAWGVSLVVMFFERDLGSALLFFMLFLVVVWVATGRTFYLVTGFAMFSAGAYLAWRTFDHVQTRVSMWINPWQDARGKGYQIIQASYAFAWGGIGGTGLGLGISGRVPYQETDFIFAIIGEELGLFGTVAVMSAYLLLTGVGLRVAIRSSDPFQKLLGVGLTTIIAVQSFLIMGGVIRLLPLTGVTLPFLSYGGSSLVANWIAIALLIRLSDEQGAEQQPAADETTTMARPKAMAS